MVLGKSLNSGSPKQNLTAIKQNTMKTLPALLLALALSATAFAAPVTNAKGEEVFLFDWHKQQPAFRKLWREQIGKHAPKAPMHNWVRQMAGPMPPLERVNIGGKTYYYTTMCQPHNCGGNNMYILTDKQHIAAYHVVYKNDDSFSADNPDQIYIYGKPTEAELNFLKSEWRKAWLQ